MFCLRLCANPQAFTVLPGAMATGDPPPFISEYLWHMIFLLDRVPSVRKTEKNNAPICSTNTSTHLPPSEPKQANILYPSTSSISFRSQRFNHVGLNIVQSRLVWKTLSLTNMLCFFIRKRMTVTATLRTKTSIQAEPDANVHLRKMLPWS